MNADVGLIRYDHMCTAIAECHRVDEVKELRNKAKALEVYAKQARNVEAERKCCEVRIRAERRAGELLREMKNTGQRDSGGRGRIESRPATQLKDLGITRDQSSKWQQLANVPADDFERAVNGDGPKPSTEGIINANIGREDPMPNMDLAALFLWGRLRDFERMGLLDKGLTEWLEEMTEAMRDDCLRILPVVEMWVRLWVAKRQLANIRSWNGKFDDSDESYAGREV